MQTTFNNQTQTEKQARKGAIREVIGKLAKGLMLPIAMLPIAGLFLGIGSTIISQTENSVVGQIIGKLIQAPGSIIFDLLPLLFAIAIAITFANDSGTCALSAVLGYGVFITIQSSIIIYPNGNNHYYHYLFYKFNTDTFNALFSPILGINTLSSSIFGGMIIGGLVAYLYNKYKTIQLPKIMGFFSGIRFIPIISFLFCALVGLVFAIIWPVVGMGIYYIGQGLSYGGKYGGVTSLAFGILNRSLVPFGLHHALDIPLWFSSIGGSLNTNDFLYLNGTETRYQIYELANDVQGSMITGDINMQIYLTKIVGRSIEFNGGLHTITIQDIIDSEAHLSRTFAFGQYTNFAYVYGPFGLAGAALGMLMAAPKGEQRKLASSIIIPAALINVITGISEPIEFTFLFLAPYLYFGFHTVMAGLGGMITTILIYYVPSIAPHVGFSFSSGLIDFIIYGVVPDARGGGTHCWVLLLMSLCYMPIYFFVFRWAIIKWNLKTPGRDGATKLFSKADWIKKRNDGKADINAKQQLTHDKTIEIIKAYGGVENIVNIDACITKLRIQVKDRSKVDEERLKQIGALGISHPSPQSVYAVFGQEADIIKTTMKEIIAKGEIINNDIINPQEKIEEENVKQEDIQK